MRKYFVSVRRISWIVIFEKGIAATDRKSHFEKINGKLHANRTLFFSFILISSQRKFNRTKMQIHNFLNVTVSLMLSNYAFRCRSFWVDFSPRHLVLQHTNLKRFELTVLDKRNLFSPRNSIEILALGDCNRNKFQIFSESGVCPEQSLADPSNLCRPVDMTRLSVGISMFQHKQLVDLLICQRWSRWSEYVQCVLAFEILLTSKVRGNWWENSLRCG